MRRKQNRYLGDVRVNYQFLLELPIEIAERLAGMVQATGRTRKAICVEGLEAVLAAWDPSKTIRAHVNYVTGSNSSAAKRVEPPSPPQLGPTGKRAKTKAPQMDWDMAARISAYKRAHPGKNSLEAVAAIHAYDAAEMKCCPEFPSCTCGESPWPVEEPVVTMTPAPAGIPGQTIDITPDPIDYSAPTYPLNGEGLAAELQDLIARHPPYVRPIVENEKVLAELNDEANFTPVRYFAPVKENPDPIFQKYIKNFCPACQGRGNLLNYNRTVAGRCEKCEGTGLAPEKLTKGKAFNGEKPASIKPDWIKKIDQPVHIPPNHGIMIPKPVDPDELKRIEVRALAEDHDEAEKLAEAAKEPGTGAFDRLFGGEK